MTITTEDIYLDTKGFSDILDVTPNVMIDHDNRPRNRHVVVQVVGE